MSAVANQDVVCVLGMHRSGTSLLARTLNLISLHLGFESTLATQSAPHNAKGHWEHQEFTAICDAILKRYRGSWDDPPLYPPGWETSLTVKDLNDQALRLFQREFEDVQQWGWKDPRSSLTLPFWQQLIPHLRYIICLRNPVDVCLSLANRDGFSAEKSSYLWFTYVCRAMAGTQGKERLVVFYEDLLDDGLAQLEQLAEFLGQLKRAREVDVRNAVLEFIDKDLQHYRTSFTSKTVGSRIEFYSQALYLTQRMAVTLASNKTSRLDNGIEALASLIRHFPLNDSNGALVRGQKTGQARKRNSHLIEKDQMLSRQLAEIVQAVKPNPQKARQLIDELSIQLLSIQSELPRFHDPFGRRLLSRYKHTRSYLTPIYQHFFQRLVKPVQPDSP